MYVFQFKKVKIHYILCLMIFVVEIYIQEPPPVKTNREEQILNFHYITTYIYILMTGYLLVYSNYLISTIYPPMPYN